MLRFTNREIHEDAEAVADRILAAIEELGPVPQF